MGKMILDDLRKRLERLDEDADLMIDNNDRYQMVIVGGSAFILLGKLTRATHDIDALSVPKELYGLLGKYDINTDVEAYDHHLIAVVIVDHQICVFVQTFQTLAEVI